MEKQLSLVHGDNFHGHISPEQERSLNIIDGQLATHITSGIEIGKELNYLKSITPHGQFGDLVEWRFGLKASQRCSYMRVAKVFGKQSCGIPQFSNEVLSVLLESPDPETALQEASGQESITAKQAKKLVEVQKENERQHRLIEGLGSQIKELKSQLPTEDTLSRISSLESQLKDAQNKPSQVIEKEVIKEVVKEIPTIPSDYEQAKKDARKAKDLAERLTRQNKKNYQLEASNKALQAEAKMTDNDKILVGLLGEIKTLRQMAGVLISNISFAEAEQFIDVSAVKKELTKIKKDIDAFTHKKLEILEA